MYLLGWMQPFRATLPLTKLTQDGGIVQLSVAYVMPLTFVVLKFVTEIAGGPNCANAVDVCRRRPATNDDSARMRLVSFTDSKGNDFAALSQSKCYCYRQLGSSAQL